MKQSKFQCYRSGWCCGAYVDKYTTQEEFDIARVELLKHNIKLTGSQLPNGFVLWAKPCPALVMANGKASCLIYDKRPYPCRQFLCGRMFAKDSRPFKDGYKFNMEYFDKLIASNPEFAKIKENMENKAAIWGKKHGWKLERVK